MTGFKVYVYVNLHQPETLVYECLKITFTFEVEISSNAYVLVSNKCTYVCAYICHALFILHILAYYDFLRFLLFFEIRIVSKEIDVCNILYTWIYIWISNNAYIIWIYIYIYLYCLTEIWYFSRQKNPKHTKNLNYGLFPLVNRWSSMKPLNSRIYTQKELWKIIFLAFEYVKLFLKYYQNKTDICYRLVLS